MAETIRYRPVVLGQPPDEGEVWYFAENPDGSVFLRDGEWPHPVGTPLESVTVDHLPEYYLNLPGFREGTRILPIREARGRTRLMARDALLQAIEALALTGLPTEFGQDQQDLQVRERGASV